MPGGSCTVAWRVASCSLPPIAVGGQVQISVTGRLPSDAAAEQLLNGVQVAPDVFTPTDTIRPVAPFGPIGPLPLPPAGGSSTPPGDVVRPAADVGVAKVATPDPLARDGRATWHVRTTNHGPSTATRIKIRDTLPARARFLRATGAGRCTVRGRIVTCRLRSLRAGRSAQTRIVARLRARRHAGPLRNTIVLDAAQPDPAAANNRDRTSAALAPRLTVRKTVNARTAKLGDKLTYTLRLRNGGPGTARNVVLCDRPGAGLMLLRAPRGARSQTGGLLDHPPDRSRPHRRSPSAGRRHLRQPPPRHQRRHGRIRGRPRRQSMRVIPVVLGLPPGVTG